jgi:hypothetical protein
MRIKNHSSRNQYLQTPSGIWVRNFLKDGVSPLDINQLTRKEDYGLLLKNELANNVRQVARIDLEKVQLPKVVIVSDGHKFAEKHQVLANLPKDVAIIAVNGALSKWKLLAGTKKAINFFVTNNPYHECVAMLPRKTQYYPKCIISSRTNPDFVRMYKGVLYQYSPVPEVGYSSTASEVNYQIDDYRNPVCAAIGLSYRFNTSRVLLFCCDDAFDEERPGTDKMANGLWSYPQQRMAQEVVDANLHWLKQREDIETQIGVFGSGPEYKNARYINEEEIVSFFANE